ncbi:ICAM-like surface protein [Trypanosoma grayi]|uniref:ICAM-like surface protein n=1 Tax=Trypanosoma grayi TaxID=71804 RepID=UPI0004F42CD3|nr:ICAM-like surface protein [Trypanosoma grayi]KEG08592.1 ICAM-like surface protein [Trypanosoma grayi]
MGNPAKRSATPKRGKRGKGASSGGAAPAAALQLPPPPPPFLCLSRGSVYTPEPTTLDVTVTVPLQQLQNRAGVYDAVLRSVLHRLHGAPSSSSEDPAAVMHRTVVHVESITIHTDSARQASHTGDVQLRATVAAVLACVKHGLLFGVAESSTYTDTMVVRIRCEDPEGAVQQRNGNTKSKDEEGDAGTTLVTARCLEEEPVAVGQTVLVVSEPGTLRCLAIRPPRKAPGPFKLHVENGVAEILADWPEKKKGPRRDEAACT